MSKSNSASETGITNKTFIYEQFPTLKLTDFERAR
jgi:hypothetical protein